MKQDPPECRKCGKTLEWLPWKNGKPQQPIDPSTKQPCNCWKKKGGGDFMSKSGRMFDKKDKYKPCPYCDGWYHIDEGNEIHEEAYHKDKKVHKGEYIIGKGCFSDEVKVKKKLT